MPKGVDQVACSVDIVLEHRLPEVQRAYGGAFAVCHQRLTTQILTRLFAKYIATIETLANSKRMLFYSLGKAIHAEMWI